MNYLGVYHSAYPKSTSGICDAPCISKGKMMLCERHAASEGCLLAMAYGRIRNREALIRELKCDEKTGNAAIVLNAFRRWGTAYPKHIEGAAVTCILDSENDFFILSRDRMGEMPVFYSSGAGGRVVFSDHPDSLLKIAAAAPAVDEQGLCELFALGPARTPGLTPLRDIRSLGPGCMLTGKNGICCVEQYFRIMNAPHKDNEYETVRHTRQLLDQAMDEAAVHRPGVMLSGGLDSTAITALLRLRQEEITSFSVDYPDDGLDFRPSEFRPERDAAYVELAVRIYGTRHHNVLIEQAMLADSLEAAVSARGFPGMADIDSSLLKFAAGIAKHKKTVLSGECGDEVFGGYPWFCKNSPMSGMFPWSGSMELRERILRPELRKKLNLRKYAKERYAQAIAAAEVDGPDAEPEVVLKRMQMVCFRYFMPNLQERASAMCGSAGVEVLTPFCDDRLIQYVYNVPWNMKFMGGMEKGLLRAAVRDCIPSALLTRKKSPYPKTSSPVYTEIIRGLTMAMLSDREAPIHRIIDAEAVRGIAESALDPSETPWYGQLMAGSQMLAYLWQVNTWMRDRDITVEL